MKLGWQFLILSLLLSSAIFRGALWGDKLIAPLDIAADLFAEYHFLDPQADGIPENHYVVDQLTYDLPLQKVIYDSYHRGEIPWWTPYTYGGRPLLADAHCNGTNPIRLFCYALLPFELAYNWNLILQGMLTGLTVLCLLRHLRLPSGIILPLALTAQFAGCFALYIGHPWIQSSALYFPLLWIALDKYLERPDRAMLAAGSLATGLIFWSGNLQSHAYAVIFCLLWLLAVGVSRRKLLPRAFISCLICGLAGAALALPVLANQLELFWVSVRPIAPASSGYLSALGGLFSLSFPHPYFLGTFRTFDLGKLADQNAAGFQLFIGPILAICAVFGACTIIKRQREKLAVPTEWLALLLPLFHLVICSTPLVKILYPRFAPLGVLGLTVLAAFGLRAIFSGEISERSLRLIRSASLCLLLAIMLQAALLPVFYPKIRAYLETRIQAAANVSPDAGAMSRLRAFQLTNFVRETTVQNPAVALSGIALLAFLAGSWTTKSIRKSLLFATLALNLGGVAVFYAHYIPLQPISVWKRLQDGGPLQTGWANVLNPQHLRLLEGASSMDRMVFPNEMGHLWKVHTVHGYAALQPPSVFYWPQGRPAPSAAQVSDFESSLTIPAQPTGMPMSRYAWQNPQFSRSVQIVEEDLNRLTLAIGPGEAAVLTRTDTGFAGWTAFWNGQPVPLERTGPVFSEIRVEAAGSAGSLEFRYAPAWLYPTAWISISAASVLVWLLLWSVIGRQNSAGRGFGLGPEPV